METNTKPNCYKCVHYSVTWNPKSPHACKFYGFSSTCLPTATVYKTTGTECMGFEKKPSG